MQPYSSFVICHLSFVICHLQNFKSTSGVLWEMFTPHGTPSVGLRPFCLSFSSFVLRPLSFVFIVVFFFAGCQVPEQNPGLHLNEDRVRHFNEDGIFLFQKGDYFHAKESFALALEEKPNDPSLLFNLGQCYDRMGINDQAEKCYRLCLDQEANHAETRQSLAKLLYRQGRNQEADETNQGWLVSQPDLADAYVQDAWRLQQEGDLPKAQARLQQALAKDPHNVRALMQLGILNEIQERPDRARALYEKALLVDPQRTDLKQRVHWLMSRGVELPLPD